MFSSLTIHLLSREVSIFFTHFKKPLPFSTTPCKTSDSPTSQRNMTQRNILPIVFIITHSTITTKLKLAACFDEDFTTVNADSTAADDDFTSANADSTATDYFTSAHDDYTSAVDDFTSSMKFFILYFKLNSNWTLFLVVDFIKPLAVVVFIFI